MGVRALAGASLVAAALLVAHEAGAQSHHGHRRRHAAAARVNLHAYRDSVRSWHDASTAAPAAHTPEGSLVLRLYSVNTRERAEVLPAPAGSPERFDATAQAQVAQILIDARSRQTHAIDPHLIELLYDVAVHFNAPEVRVISGFRAGSGHSNHSLGRAVDFIIPGATDAQVADYARTLGEVGVGLYPVSGFVHLDVRDRATSWVDTSGPGRPPRYRHHRGHARRTASRGSHRR